MQRSRVGVMLVGVYLVAVLLSIGLIVVSGEALSGIWLVILTLPWSLLFTPVLDAISPSLAGSWVSYVLFASGALINAAIIYALVVSIGRLLRRTR